MKLLIAWLVWGSVSAACIGLFLPWARIDVRQGLMKDLGRVTATVRRGAKTVVGDVADLGQIPTQVTGIQIPWLVRQENAQVAVVLLELLTNQRQHLEWKSLAVFLVPGLAVCCGLLILGPVGKPPAAWMMAALCLAIAVAGCWRLLTLNTRTLVAAITIGPGLWLSLWGYVGLAIAAGWRGAVRGTRA